MRCARCRETSEQKREDWKAGRRIVRRVTHDSGSFEVSLRQRAHPVISL